MRPFTFAFRPVSLVLLIAASLWSVPSRAEDCQQCGTVLTLKSLVRMDCDELAALYRSSPPACLQTGYYKGRAIYKAGTPMTVPAAGLVRLIWHGKHIDRCNNVMTNKVIGGKKAIRAKIYDGESWLDGGPSLIMDYAMFPSFAEQARDEVRQVAPGLYLGAMYIRQHCEPPKFSMFFALEQTSCCATPSRP